MIEPPEEPITPEDLRDVLERIDYHEIRTSRQIELLEIRVRTLEAALRDYKDSGEGDLRRLQNLCRSIFRRKGADSNSHLGNKREAKPFPITMRQTSIGVAIVAGIVTVIRSANDSVSAAQLLGRWFGVFIFSAGLPALLAYVIAGRKENWSRYNRWFSGDRW